MALTPTATFIASAGSTTAAITTTSFTPAFGDIIVIKATAADSAASHRLGVPSTTGLGMTFTKQLENFPGNHTYEVLYTAVASAGGVSSTVSIAGSTGAVYHNMVVEQWPGSTCKLAASPALMSSASSASSAPTGVITTAANGSAVTWLSGDWAAVDGTTRTYNSVSATPTEDLYIFQTLEYTTYAAYQQAATAGVQTLGVTLPVGQAWNMLAVEIQAVSVAAAPLPKPLVIPGVAVIRSSTR